MRAGDSIFVIGEAPEENMVLRAKHPVDESREVRFVKNYLTDLMYFNVLDFIVPYKRDDFTRIMKSLLPSKINRLDRIWMSVKAWTEIADGVRDGKVVNEITKTWDLVPNKRGEFTF